MNLHNGPHVPGIAITSSPLKAETTLMALLSRNHSTLKTLTPSGVPIGRTMMAMPLQAIYLQQKFRIYICIYIYIYIYPTILFLLCNNTPQEIIQHTCQDTSSTWASALGSHGESSCIWHLSCHHPSRPHHLVGGDATVDQEAATPSFCFWTKDPTNAQWCSLPSWTTQCAYIRSDCRPSGQAGCNLEIFGHLQDGVGRALTEGHAPYHLHLASDIFIDILL